MGQKAAKFDYGIHETAVCQSNDVAELADQKKKCEKNHKNYIAVEDLTVEHFPEPYREQNVYDLTRFMAALTVRIAVKYCSLERQRNWQGTEAEYPGYSHRGQADAPLMGSGRICDVNQKEEEKALCPCRKCTAENSSSKEVWTIWVYTAMHVVYNSVEAANSNCKLFYDMGDGTSKSFYGVKKLWANVHGDLCMISCVTCDKELADTIHSTIKSFNILWRGIRENYKKDKENSEGERKYKNRIVIIVSHPHGGPKKVSFGELVSKFHKNISEDKGWHLNYKASTCSGSSGAPVYLFGQDWFQTEYVHSGSNGDVNYSTTWCPE